MYLIICLVILIAVLYRFLIQPLNYWKNLGVIYQKPWPIFGNMASTVFRQRSAFDQVLDFYNKFPSERYNGIYQFTQPMLLVRDLDLLKQIMIKDFDHFSDHAAVFPENDQLMGKNLFFLKGQRWREIRATVSPSFTGSKMRFIFGLASECASMFIDHIEKKASPMFVAEMRDLHTRFANDIVASVVFGYKCDSLAEPENDFYLKGKQSTAMTLWRLLSFFLISSNSFIAKWVKSHFIEDDLRDFFVQVVKDNLKKREKHGIVRPDVIQLLIDARYGRSKVLDNRADSANEGFAVAQELKPDNTAASPDIFLTDDDIISQAFGFFFSGFDAVATLSTFVSYELAVNIDIQEKLQSEIDKALEECNGEITYNALLGIEYLDMVVSETLRKWAFGFQIDRLCIKDYEIKPVKPEEKPFVVKKGTSILIPIAGIHRDPKYYQDPEKFDPERFSDKNKHLIPSLAFMPFGAGPRNCIASRFALLECKILICHLLSKFTITVVDKTPIPLKLSKKTFNVASDKELWLGFKLRREA